MTEGILNRQLVADPFLEGVGAVVLDEFHERSLHTDLAIALLREVRESVRDDLILVVMSATMEAEPVAKFLGDAPILRVEGRSFPVEIRYCASSNAPLADRVASLERLWWAEAGHNQVLPLFEGPASLVALPGIGPWTAEYVAMRALRDPDAFMPTDLGIRRGAAARGLPEDPGALVSHAEAWRPWRSYAMAHLWAVPTASTPRLSTRRLKGRAA